MGVRSLGEGRERGGYLVNYPALEKLDDQSSVALYCLSTLIKLCEFGAAAAKATTPFLGWGDG